jgi:hypothetical protein
MLACAAWRSISWRRGTKGPLRATFAALRVRPADDDAAARDGIHLCERRSENPSLKRPGCPVAAAA